jgi:hypothetical protein
LELKRDSNLFNFFKHYFISEILFFIGTGILIIIKMIFSLDMGEIMEGTFVGPASVDIFTEAFSQAQIDWLFQNLLLWWVNVFLAFFTSLLLLTGFFALAILLPLNIRIFEGPNAITAEAIPIGLLYLICWGIFPTLYIVRSTFIDWGVKIKNRVISPTKTS